MKHTGTRSSRVRAGVICVWALACTAPGLAQQETAEVRRATSETVSLPSSPATAPVPASRANSLPGTVTAPIVRPEYRLGPGDVLQVTVWNENEASAPTVVVRPDGRISLPLIRDIEAQGLTTLELEQQIAQRLAKVIRTLDVSVVVKEANSSKVFLVGAVRREGSVKLTSAMTVLQVIAEAGGLSDYAKRKKIYVLRTENRKRLRLPFDYDAVVKGNKMEQNIIVNPGDTIIVPQ